MPMTEPQRLAPETVARVPEAPTPLVLDVPQGLLEAADKLAASLGLSREEALLHLIARGVEHRSVNGTAQASMREAPALLPIAHAAWRATAPPATDRPLAGHEWAENLVPTLPLRFQKYIAELLFDDERILCFVQRPSFTVRHRWPWKKRRATEGLLLVTDRMVMMIEDAIPPGPLFIDWGYSAWITAVERVQDASLHDEGEALSVRITCRAARGAEDQDILIPREQRADVSDAMALLNRYGSEAQFPARCYSDGVPAWEPPDARAARLRIAGRADDEPEEREQPGSATGTDGTRISLNGDRLVVSGRDEAVIPLTDISSVRIWRAVTGCTLEVGLPGEASGKRRVAVFQYPQSSPFLRIASRLRHAMGRPLGNLDASSA